MPQYREMWLSSSPLSIVAVTLMFVSVSVSSEPNQRAVVKELEDIKRLLSKAGRQDTDDFRRLEMLVDAVSGELPSQPELSNADLLAAKDLAARLEAGYAEEASKARRGTERRLARKYKRQAEYMHYATSVVEEHLLTRQARMQSEPITQAQSPAQESLPQSAAFACFIHQFCEPPTSADEEAEARFEQCVRIRRLKSMFSVFVTTPFQIEELEETTLLSYPIPALRITWPENAFFDVDEDQVRMEGDSVIQLVAKSLADDVEDLHVYVLGHTDDTGTRQHNQDLSERRASGVAKRLAALGIPKSRVTHKGLGEFQPVKDNQSPEGRAANRRVEIMLSQYKEANHKLIETRPVKRAFRRPDEQRRATLPPPNEERFPLLPKPVASHCAPHNKGTQSPPVAARLT